MSADADLRARFADLPIDVEFDPVQLNQAPPLEEATVALVTTAALGRPGEPWVPGTHEFRVLEGDLDDVIMGHNSTNLDRTGFAADRNVAFPIDRLHEMAAAGDIGKVAPRHMSFLGSVFELSTFVLDTGPAAAKMLVEDEVDVVLLCPV